jgi:hypothetical protein
VILFSGFRIVLLIVMFVMSVMFLIVVLLIVMFLIVVLLVLLIVVHVVRVRMMQLRNSIFASLAHRRPVVSHALPQTSFLTLEFGTQGLFVGRASSVNSFVTGSHILMDGILASLAQFFPVRVHASAHSVAVCCVGTKGLSVFSTGFEITPVGEGKSEQ